MTRLIYLDQDGILAGMTDAVVKRLNLSAGFTWPGGVWNETEATGVPRAEFYAACADHAFWADEIPLLPYARTLFDTAVTLVGLANIRISTCPTESPHSASGKLVWLRRHFPELASSQIHLGCSKWELAGPGRVLLDDKPENCKLWRAAGGEAVLVPAVGNHRHATSPLVAVQELQDLFASRLERTTDGRVVLHDANGGEVEIYGRGMRVTVVGCEACPPVVGV